MDSLFLTILNMSITGAFVIAAICLARLPLKKAPKIISYCLWAVAGFRLVFPFSIESIFSLMPFNATPIPPDMTQQAVFYIESIPAVSNTAGSMLSPAAVTAGAGLLQFWMKTGAYVWITVSVLMIVFGVISYIRLKLAMRSALHLRDNIYLTDIKQAPFVLGFVDPGIYLPPDAEKKEYEYIILHEQTHIKRRDHISKAVAYMILCVHWFNPLAWAAFLLMSADMEMSCDEHVLKVLGPEEKKGYSLSLLSQASGRRVWSGSPLAFSEGGIKERVKRVLNFRKPSRIVIVSTVMLAALFSIGFALNKATDDFVPEPDEIISVNELPEPVETVEKTEVLFNNGQVNMQTSVYIYDDTTTDTIKWEVNTSENNVFLKGNDTIVDIDEVLHANTSSMNRHVNNNIPDLEGYTYYSKIVITNHEPYIEIDAENESPGYITIYVELDSLLHDIREIAQSNAQRNRIIDTVNYMLPVMIFPDTDDLTGISESGVEHYVSSVSIVVPRGYVLGFETKP